jgi:hypothetical protein
MKKTFAKVGLEVEVHTAPATSVEGFLDPIEPWLMPAQKFAQLVLE